jgi:hypothetical protein
MNISNLARLAQSFIVTKPLKTEMLSTTINILIKSQKEKQTGHSCAGPTFSRLTMHNNYIFRILHQPFLHVVNQLQHHMKRRSVMVLPVVVCNSPLKSLMVIFCFTYIENEIFVFMIFFKKLLYLYRN